MSGCSTRRRAFSTRVRAPRDLHRLPGTDRGAAARCRGGRSRVPTGLPSHRAASHAGRARWPAPGLGQRRGITMTGSYAARLAKLRRSRWSRHRAARSRNAEVSISAAMSITNQKDDLLAVSRPCSAATGTPGRAPPAGIPSPPADPPQGEDQLATTTAIRQQSHSVPVGLLETGTHRRLT